MYSMALHYESLFQSESRIQGSCLVGIEVPSTLLHIDAMWNPMPCHFGAFGFHNNGGLVHIIYHATNSILPEGYLGANLIQYHTTSHVYSPAFVSHSFGACIIFKIIWMVAACTLVDAIIILNDVLVVCTALEAELVFTLDTCEGQLLNRLHVCTKPQIKAGQCSSCCACGPRSGCRPSRTQNGT